jgi:hypothetical protein
VLESIDNLYIACRYCATEPALDKSLPLRDLPDSIKRCPACGKAPLDAVMLDCLHIMAEHGIREPEDGLRSVGWPLVSVGFPLAYPPRLGPDSLIVMGEQISRAAAEAIVDQVPEVKGVILSKSIPGVASDGSAHENPLLAGCDLRCDLAQSIFGELVIYKNQARIHVEFPRASAPKMKTLENLYFNRRLSDVVDGLCGPGTLGLTCALAGAKRVVLNDAWLPAVENVMLNLEVNRSLLGIDEILRLEVPSHLVGDEPVLVGKASGACEIEVYFSDLKKLFSRIKPPGLCLIDHFPGADTRELEKACQCCGEIVII